MLKNVIFVLFVFFVLTAKSQDIYINIDNKGIYELIDELASSGIINASTVVKPYSRKQVGEWLLAAKSNESNLSTRQKKEINFYLKDYYKDISGYKPSKKRLDLFYYSDSNFSVTVNPIFGAFAQSNGTNVYGRYVGGEVYGKIGKGWTYYFNLRDNYENTKIRSEYFVNQNRGAVLKINKVDGSEEFNEINGGISYGWQWGSISLVKENVVWGSGYNGTNIFSGHSPSFAMIKLHLNPTKWLDFNYFHGWLVSCVIDSSTINSNPNNLFKRWEYAGKYVAANMLTIKPVKWLDFSLGSSVIYSYRTPQFPYFIPIMFFKAVDHWYSNLTDNTDQNSQMFFDLKIRPVKQIQFYSTLFVDEIGLNRMFDKKTSTNYISIKSGFHTLNWPIKNTFFTFEYIRSNPFAYNHWSDVQTYATNKYNFGSYLRDNSDEIYASIKIKPYSNFHIMLDYTKSRKGPDYRLNDKYYAGDWYMKEVTWQRKAITGQISYQPINDLYINLGYEYSDISGKDMSLYTPTYMQGKKSTLFGSVNIGF
jgi:hypothetical protein